mgnify:CR=1 FL=1
MVATRQNVLKAVEHKIGFRELYGVEQKFDEVIKEIPEVTYMAITDAEGNILYQRLESRSKPAKAEAYFKSAPVLALLAEAARRVRAAGYEIGNVDSTVIAEAPRLAPHVPAMRQRLAQANKIAAAYYVRALASPEASIGRQFLTERGFDADAAAHFGVGYAPKGWDVLLTHLRSKGFTDDQLVEGGLVARGAVTDFSVEPASVAAIVQTAGNQTGSLSLVTGTTVRGSTPASCASSAAARRSRSRHRWRWALPPRTQRPRRPRPRLIRPAHPP